jgi:hypothetical protein
MWFLVPRCRPTCPGVTSKVSGPVMDQSWISPVKFSVFVWTDIRILENMEKFSDIHNLVKFRKYPVNLMKSANSLDIFWRISATSLFQVRKCCYMAPVPEDVPGFARRGWWGDGVWGTGTNMYFFLLDETTQPECSEWFLKIGWFIYIYIHVYIIFLPQVLFETVTQSRRWKGAAQPLHVFREFQETPDYHLGVAWGLLRMIIFSSESPIPTGSAGL